MRCYCLDAKRHGDEKIPDGSNPRRITVILNPNANRRKATKQFEKYCAPILHLAGICVDVLTTENEGHARTLVEELKQTDAIIVAGGDGTISEVVTGLFRRTNNDRTMNPCPVGVLPLGRTNTLAKIFFPGGETLATVRSLADASMAIVEGNTKLVDVMKIEIINENSSVDSTDINNIKITVDDRKENPKENAVVNEEIPPPKTDDKEVNNDNEKNVAKSAERLKPVYALAALEWGAYRDAYAKQDKYWYWGSLRRYATYIFNGYKKTLTWECNACINYLSPCEGCSNCYVKTETPNRRWWSSFFTKRKPAEKDYSKVINEKCAIRHQKEISTTDFLLTTAILNEGSAQLHLNIGPESMEYLDFVSEGFRTLNGQRRKIKDTIEARQVEIVPKNLDPEKEVWFSIDKEEYEVKPVRITLLPRVLRVFCKHSS